MLTKNQKAEVTIETATTDGYGICRLEDRVVFVSSALAGERWEILILKVTNTAVWAKGTRLLEASAERCEPDCRTPCGGCSLRYASYSEELRLKKTHVDDCLQRIGKQKRVSNCIHPSPQTERYRNKAIFAVDMLDGKAAFGFYRPHSHTLVPISDCLLQSRNCLQAAGAAINFMNRHGIPAYDEESGKGIVRHLFWRESRKGDGVLCIVAARGFGQLTGKLTESLRESCPYLTGIVLNINKTKGNTVLAGEFYTLWGNPFVHESLCGNDFEIAPQAFLQINPGQAESLYRKALEYACDSENENSITSSSGAPSGRGESESSQNDVMLTNRSTGCHCEVEHGVSGEQDTPSVALDLYCGAGTVTLCLARAFDRAIGAEIIPEAIENAKKNAESNGITNAEFVCADAAIIAESFRQTGLKPDAVVVDPPRKGLAESVVRDIAGMEPKRVVYISCNPATLARDVERFNTMGYFLCKAEVFDMFPRSSHVETVCLLTHKD